MGNRRARKPPGDRIELGNRGANLPKGGHGLLGSSAFGIHGLDASASPPSQLRLDEPAEVGGYGDPLAKCCLPKCEPLILRDSHSSDLGVTRHGSVNDATCRTLVQVCKR